MDRDASVLDTYCHTLSLHSARPTFPCTRPLARPALRPDGLFLGAFLGGDSLATLRSVLLEAEAARPAARTHPRIDVRSAGDLLVRAGFALPVADTETLTVRYRDLVGSGSEDHTTELQ